MKKFKNILLVLSLILTFSLVSTSTDAQCPMCKMSAEQNLKDGGTAGKGLNKGIFMMLAMPYLLVGTMGVLWYRNRKKEDE
ncbi:MAG: hypothetical protein ACI8P3_001876 [Saprospiraceae bacterium]|jgi:hypothetical protein